MEIKYSTKSRHLNASERFKIRKENKNKPILNEQNSTNTDVTFGLIINRDKTKDTTE
jgi:hypothetical protein